MNTEFTTMSNTELISALKSAWAKNDVEKVAELSIEVNHRFDTKQITWENIQEMDDQI